jgi:peptidyl-tRNA hydrolase
MKQVIVVDMNLKLPPGKLAAQVAHAAVAAYLEARPFDQKAWLLEGMPKVVLKIEGETALLALYDRARARQLPAQLIADAGRTVLPGGAMTCLGLGPADDAEIDALTGALKLL